MQAPHVLKARRACDRLLQDVGEGRKIHPSIHPSNTYLRSNAFSWGWKHEKVLVHGVFILVLLAVGCGRIWGHGGPLGVGSYVT